MVKLGGQLMVTPTGCCAHLDDEQLLEVNLLPSVTTNAYRCDRLGRVMDLRSLRSGQDPHRSHEKGGQLRLRRVRACNDNDLSRWQHHHRNLRCRKSPAQVGRYCSGRCVELGLRRL
nr:hypothetical protein [Xanthomonas citri]